MHASLPPIYALLANIQIARSRTAPKLVLQNTRKCLQSLLSNYSLIHAYDLGQDILTGEKSKEDYYRDSAQFLNAGEKATLDSGEGAGGSLAFLTRGVLLI